MKQTVIALAAAGAALQAADPETTSTAVNLTVRKIIEDGGMLMYVLLGLSVIAVMLILYYLMAFRKNNLLPPALLNALRDADGDIDAIRAVDEGRTSVLGRIVTSACTQFEDEEDGGTPGLFQGALEEEGTRQSSRLWGQLQYLADVATIAPMVGLLGTVWGMMISFTGLENDIANKADRLASGVATAMYTTFGGLIIGIGALAAYALFRGHLTSLVCSLEQECSRLAARVTARHDARRTAAAGTGNDRPTP